MSKIAAGFTNSATLNGDKFSTLSYLFTLSQQHGMIWAGMGLKAPNSTASADEMVAGDIATAKAFGARIKAVAERWAA